MQTSPSIRSFRQAAVVSVFLLAFLLAAAALPAAAGERLEIDAAKSQLTFVLDATGHDVHGSLGLERGAIDFDRASGTAAGEIVIDARSAVTGNASRDEKMHGEVLQSAKFTDIVFHPEKLEGPLPESGKGSIVLRGKLALLGISHELLLPAEVEIAGRHLSARSTFAIPYVAWGLEDPSIFVLKVAKEVKVTLAIEGALSPLP